MASRPMNVLFFFPSAIASFVRIAAPMAPIMPGYGARTIFLPVYCSKALKTASFRNVPPWTMILSPRESRFEMRMTFVKTFSMMERQSPAMMSSGFLPFLCSVTILLFMKTVQRLPRTAGASDRKAAEAISVTGIFKVEAKFSRKEPHPEEHASFTRMFVMIPWSSQIAFISWPPISRRNVISGMYWKAALAWATVSTTWYSVENALENSSSPYPVEPQPRISKVTPASWNRFLMMIRAFFATVRGSPWLEA